MLQGRLPLLATLRDMDLVMCSKGRLTGSSDEEEGSLQCFAVAKLCKQSPSGRLTGRIWHNIRIITQRLENSACVCRVVELAPAAAMYLLAAFSFGHPLLPSLGGVSDWRCT